MKTHFLSLESNVTEMALVSMEKPGIWKNIPLSRFFLYKIEKVFFVT